MRWPLANVVSEIRNNMLLPQALRFVQIGDVHWFPCKCSRPSVYDSNKVTLVLNKRGVIVKFLDNLATSICVSQIHKKISQQIKARFAVLVDTCMSDFVIQQHGPTVENLKCYLLLIYITFIFLLINVVCSFVRSFVYLGANYQTDQLIMACREPFHESIREIMSKVISVRFTIHRLNHRHRYIYLNWVLNISIR